MPKTKEPEAPEPDPSRKSLRILLNVRSNLYFEGIKSLLSGGESQPCRFSVYHTGTIGRLKPHIIILDEKATDLTLVNRYPEAKVAVLCNSLETDDIMALASMRKIHGVISHQADAMRLRNALEKMFNGEIWLDKDIVKDFTCANDVSPNSCPCLSEASRREKEVIRHVCSGHSNKEVASMIGVSERTVKAHLHRIFKKFKLSSRLELAILAMKSRSEME
ncbi:MAG: response regulator transcription factor [Nitrospirales bacterium]|nr:response regulator transcription factor [Nitrospirales bacterium]